MFNREFRRFKGAGNAPTIEFLYKSNESPITKIEITREDETYNRYSDRNKNNLNIQCADSPEGRSLAERITAACNAVKIWEGTNIEENALRKSGPLQFYTKYTKVDDLKRLINVLYNGIAAIDENTHNQLLADLDVMISSVDVHASVIAKTATDIAEAKRLALQYNEEYGYYEILWVLAEHFKESGLINDAAEMYAAIPTKSKKYFTQACTQLLALYQNQLTAHQFGYIHLTPEKIQFVREKLLELSLLAGDQEQFSLHMFYDLAGFNLTHSIPKMTLNGNPETFIVLAREMAALNNKNKKLQDELETLRNGTHHSSTIVSTQTAAQGLNSNTFFASSPLPIQSSLMTSSFNQISTQFSETTSSAAMDRSGK